jgi:hypothetical protein
MPSSLNGTGVTFNDGTTQSTAATAGNYIQQRYTSPATWTKAAGLKAVKITLVGGGGGGGGVRTANLYTGNGGGGGGGGGASLYLPAASIPGPVTVTVGAGGTGGVPPPSTPGVVYATGGTGGTTSFGPFCSATGGAGGNSQNNLPFGFGGAGTGGNINQIGGKGDSLDTFNGSPTRQMKGGGYTLVSFSGGGPNAAFSTSTAGDAAVANTGCGGGGAGNSVPAQAANGGAGAAGVVIVEEFY